MLAAGARLGENTCFYLFSTYVIAYAHETLRLEDGIVLHAVLMAAAMSFVVMPLFGLLSDHWSRKGMYMSGCLFLMLFAFPYFTLLDTREPVLVQMAVMLGARAIATVGTEAKAELARQAGASDAILYNQQDWVAEVKRLTNGEGVDVVYDSVGQATYLKGFECLKPRGMMVHFGAASGPIEPLETRVLTKRFGLPNSASIDTYLATDGYKAFLKAAGMTPEAIMSITTAPSV